MLLTQKRFWKTIEPVFRNKIKTCNNISAIKNLLLSHKRKQMLKSSLSLLLLSFQI